MLFRCPCPGKDALKLSESGCDCEAAVSARTDLSNTIAAESASNEKALNAQLNGILESLEGSPELKRSLIFEQEDFQHLWDTTRSVCPAELMKVYRIGPISCRIRDVWKIYSKRFSRWWLSTDSHLLVLCRGGEYGTGRGRPLSRS